MQRLGLGWGDLHSLHPALIYCSVSGFGHTGPYQDRPAYDMVVQGMGGIMSITGHPDGEPARVGMSIGDIGAGVYAAVGINAALYERTQTGIGRHIDLSMFDCQVALVENAVARYSTTGEIPGPLGARHPSITPFGAFDTRDGQIIVAVGNDRLFTILCETIDAPELLKEKRYESNELRTKNEATLKARLNEHLKYKTTVEWLALLGNAGVPSGPINNIEEVVNDPQIAARNMIVDVNEPTLPGMRVSGNPIKISGFPDPKERGGAPSLDENRAQLIEEFGL
jgi:CoA:oxalate CoA-transferase